MPTKSEKIVLKPRLFVVPEKAVGRFALILGFFDRCTKIHSLLPPRAALMDFAKRA